MSEQSDLVHVVDRAALIENILNQVIEDFCEPRKEPFMFFWNVILGVDPFSRTPYRSETRSPRCPIPKRHTQRNFASR
jgi:hypothetical protein